MSETEQASAPAETQATETAAPAAAPDGFRQASQDMEGKGTVVVPSQAEQTGGDHTTEEAGEADRPDWLFDKYKSVEDQAKAYKDLHGKYTEKNDKFRDAVKDEVGEEYIQNYHKDRGVPEETDEYGYPEGFEAPAGEVDSALRDWAKANNVPKEAFGDLISNVWGLTQANHEAESAKLGKTPEAVQERLDPLNQWIGNTFDSGFEPTLNSIMKTAEGVEFMEGIQKAMSNSGFAPEHTASETAKAPALSREEIRGMQADQRYQSGEPAYVAKVQQAWRDFANAQE